MADEHVTLTAGGPHGRVDAHSSPVHRHRVNRGLFGACGDNGEGSASVRIDGVDIDYDRDVYEAEPGPTTIEFRNRGSLAHNIVFREAAGAPAASGEDDFLPAGQNATYEVELVAGEYEFYCSVPGHEAAGMGRDTRRRLALQHAPQFVTASSWSGRNTEMSWERNRPSDSGRCGRRVSRLLVASSSSAPTSPRM